MQNLQSLQVNEQLPPVQPLTHLHDMENEILFADDVCEYFRICRQTLKLWIARARAGLSDFPLPVGPKGSRLIFKRSEILLYKSSIGNERASPKTSTAQQKNRQAKVMAELESLLSK
jgi:hypothetical protein